MKMAPEREQRLRKRMHLSRAEAGPCAARVLRKPIPRNTSTDPTILGHAALTHCPHRLEQALL